MHRFNAGLAALAIAVMAAALTACGGSDGGGRSSAPPVDNSLARGALAANPPTRMSIPLPGGGSTSTLEPAVITLLLEAAQRGLTQITGTPKCAISTYYMQYGTVGGAGEKTDATGAIMAPSGSDAACSGPRPVLLYAHGTSTDKDFNMADLDDNGEAALVAAMFAAQGFIVVAPNYAGYDRSSLSYHPYLNGEQQANDMVDALRAARQAFPNISAQDSGQLVLAGYSQGGYVAMATQRAMQLSYPNEFTVTALAGMSGPYALSLLGDAVFNQTPNGGGTIFLPMITTSWQKSYGGLYNSPSDIYESNYASGIESLLPNDEDLDDLIDDGKLPERALFALEPTLPQPAPGFEAFFGPRNLIKTSYRRQYLTDAAVNPCNDPVTTLPLACNPTDPFRRLGVRNDLRNYVPTVPVFLCGGNADPTVFFASTQSTQAYFLSQGMPAAALTVLDVDTAPTGAADPFAAIKTGFAQAKTDVINDAISDGDDPATEVAEKYHGSLVPPFCLAAARGFFQSALVP